MSKLNLIDIALDGLGHAEAGTIQQSQDVLTVPARHYYDAERWQLEMDRVFKRLPLMLATTAELPAPGDYKALDAAGVPVLICRDQQGEIRAFINSCAHRGAQIMPEGRGQAERFTCPYHAWSYKPCGALTHIYRPQDFGDIDKSRHGLVPLPVLERSGLIWVHTEPQSSLDIELFLCGYEDVLSQFGFQDWYYMDSRRIDGPNWKIAYDGYLDFYHLPILHKDTFGSDYSCKANYYAWGPHQHVKSPDTTKAQLGPLAQQDWPAALLLTGVWTIFPHVSIASFGEETDNRGVLISQLFPGDSAQSSYTIQNYLLENTPNEAQLIEAQEQFDFLKRVVEDEDYYTGLKQQQALQTGAREQVMFGRNEGGGQRFHQWLQRILDADDVELAALFRSV